MIAWEWKAEEVKPDDVVDAARSIDVNSRRITIDPTSHWVDARRYLGWARATLSRGGEEAWDCAAGWAKRAVCRRMDGILAINHLSSFLGQNYKKKSDYLAQLNVPGLSLLRDMVIDPRNDIEHCYATATEEHARRAYEVADLFLGATETHAVIPAIAALGWNVNYMHRARSKPGSEYVIDEFTLTPQHNPMLLIDGYSPAAEILVIRPKDKSVSVCRRDSFGLQQIMELNARLRQCLSSTNNDAWFLDRSLMKTLRDQLRLPSLG